VPAIGLRFNSFNSDEICLSCAKDRGRNILASFRSPRDHIISQFFFQRDKGGWCVIQGEHDQSRCCHFPRLPGKNDTGELHLYLDFYLNKSWVPGLMKSRYFG
jgi:hypothetical protein